MNSILAEDKIIKVYVAAPFGRKAEAENMAQLLEQEGFINTASWIKTKETQDVGSLSKERQQEVANTAIMMNDIDVERCDALLALTYAGEGGELFAEVRYALTLWKPVVWVEGRQILSAYRPGVARARGFAEALTALRRGRSALSAPAWARDVL